MIKKCNYCGSFNYFNSSGYCKYCDRELPDKTKLQKREEQNKSSSFKNLFYPTVNRLTFQIEEDYETVIDRLIAQNGRCREVDSNKNNLVFNCDKDGEILITPETDEYSVFLSAKVIRCNRSTKIVADLKKRNSSTGFKILRSLLKFLFIFIAFIYIIIKNAYYTLITADLCILLVAGFTLLSSILSMQSESKKPLYDLEIMKGELIKRIKAIEKWYD